MKSPTLPSDHELVDTTKYHSLVGALHYVTFTFPNIIHAVNHHVC